MHVTVVVPVHNRETYIGEAIDSVIAQDYPDWDLVVVDDGSTDRSTDVVKSRMPNVRITFIQMEHIGPAAAVARGIEHARGPVITSLDSDDRLLPNALSTVIPVFEDNPRLGYVWTNYVDSTGKPGSNNFLPPGKTLFEALLSDYRHYVQGHERFFRKELYLRAGGLDTSIKYAEDVQLALLISRTGCDTLHIPKITYWRRLHPHQISIDRYVELMKCARMTRRKSCATGMVTNELYLSELEREIAEIEKENEMLWTELGGIRKCFGYKLMQHYGPLIDEVLPDGTKRGRIKRTIVDRLRGLRDVPREV
jgi:alpha-1,6-rhamnosyltransferase